MEQATEAADAGKKGLSGWAIVELMGHRRLAGQVSERTIAGGAFLRIDVPGDDEKKPPVTQFYGPQAIFSLTPTTEKVARAVARTARPQPVYEFEIPTLAAPRRRDDFEDPPLEPEDDVLPEEAADATRE